MANSVPVYGDLLLVSVFPPFETRMLVLPNDDEHLISYNAETGQYMITMGQVSTQFDALFKMNIHIRELWDAAENSPVDHVPTAWWDR